MPKLVRIGDFIVNLDRMTHAASASSGTAATIYFSDREEDYLTFGGENAAAITSYLTNQAFDVVEWHTLCERGRAEDAARAEERAARLKRLEHCTDPAGHVWSWSCDDGAWQCIHCHVASTAERLDQTIDCWGGMCVDELVAP